MKRLTLILLLAFLPGAAPAQDITVRVLTLAHLHQVQLTPILARPAIVRAHGRCGVWAIEPQRSRRLCSSTLLRV